MATDWNGVYRFTPANNPVLCPRRCGNNIASEPPNYGEHRMVIKPYDGSNPPDYAWDKCALRVCGHGCSQRYYVREPEANGLVGYSFECRVCDLCTPQVDCRGYCATCVLGQSGISAKALYGSLGSPVEPMGASRSQFLDGLLRGVILGAPGLVCDDPK